MIFIYYNIVITYDDIYYCKINVGLLFSYIKYDKINMFVEVGSKMKKLDLKGLKRVQVEILDVVNEFCKKHNINYWLDCGTLIGAVRHHGYIPWDDDIDIGMLRDDYNKFMTLFNAENDRYKFNSIENNNDYLIAFGKVEDTRTALYEPNKEEGIKLCINIDVFVYDNAPDDEVKLAKMFRKRDLYLKLRFAQLYPNYYDKKSLKKRIMRFFLKGYLLFLPKNYYTKKIIKNSKRYLNCNTKRVGNFSSVSKFVGDKKIFNDFVMVKFEGKEYPAPVGYDEWLKNIYGDYMKLPPKEKQVSHHSFEAYILEDGEE